MRSHPARRVQEVTSSTVCDPTSIAATPEEPVVRVDGHPVRLRPLGRGERDLVAWRFDVST